MEPIGIEPISPAKPKTSNFTSSILNVLGSKPIATLVFNLESNQEL